jgi:hypothetical protein
MVESTQIGGIMVKWYESKTVWMGIITTAIGALGLLAEYLSKGDFSASAATLLGVGVLNIVLRVWFTNAPIEK